MQRKILTGWSFPLWKKKGGEGENSITVKSKKKVGLIDQKSERLAKDEGSGLLRSLGGVKSLQIVGEMKKKGH